MYEQMKNEFLMKLVSTTDLTNEQIQSVLMCLDVANYNYDVIQKETSIVLYNQELPPLAKTFIVCKSVEGYAESTISNYKTMLTNLFFAIKKSPEFVTANDIRVYLYTYQKERQISNRSLDKVRGCICSFYKWMHTEGYIEKDISSAIPSIKYEKKPKVPCTQVDLEYLRRACTNKKQKAILEFLYSTGCRVGELIILKKSDIDWITKEVRLFGKGKKHRTSFMNAKAGVALKEYLETRKDNNEYLFVSDKKPYNQMHVCGVQKIIRELSERANSKTAKKVTPHILRHTFCTTAIEHGANLISVQKMAGHTSFNTTLNYIHTSIDEAKADHVKAVV